MDVTESNEGRPEVAVASELRDRLGELVRSHFTPDEMFGFDALRDLVAKEYDPSEVYPDIVEWVLDHYGEIVYTIKGVLGIVKFVPLDSVTAAEESDLRIKKMESERAIYREALDTIATWDGEKTDDIDVTKYIALKALHDA